MIFLPKNGNLDMAAYAYNSEAGGLQIWGYLGGFSKHYLKILKCEGLWYIVHWYSFPVLISSTKTGERMSGSNPSKPEISSGDLQELVIYSLTNET